MPNNKIINTITTTTKGSNISTISLTNTPPVYTTIQNTTSTSYEIITQERLGACLYKAINEMDKEQCAKILYALIYKLSSEKDADQLETLLKLCEGNYYKVVKQKINF